MSQIKTLYQRWDGTQWNDYWFQTSADNVIETTLKKVLTSDERTAISTYLATFNAANKLVKLDGSALIPSGLIPDISAVYLKLSGNFGHEMTDDLYMGGNDIRNIVNIVPNVVSGMYVGDFDGDGAYIFIDGNEIKFGNLNGSVVNLNSLRIINLANPTGAQDAATKSWVENLVAVGAHPAPGGSVQIASTSNYASFPSTGPLTIDGVSWLTADGQSVRVLVKNQTTVSQNGVYLVSRATGNVVTWTKQANDSLQGVLVFVEYGSTQNDWMFYNSDGTTWGSFSKVDTVVGDEVSITKSGQTFSVKALGITNAMLAGSIASAKLANEVSADTDAWGSTNAASTSSSLATKLQDIFSAIKLLRGTTTYNEQNTESIGDTYDRLDQLIPADIGCVGYLLSTSNIATLSGSQTVDGVASGTDGKLIILIGQSTSSQNGVYRTGTGAWTKLDTLVVKGYYVATAGSANANKVYRATSTTAATLTYNGTANIPVGMSVISYA